MPFVEPVTVKGAIENIHKKNYLLPAIQREFVWKADQIERLFDSLMRDYPISTFLFWELDRARVNNFQFYEFVRNFHERDNRHNPKASLGGERGIIAILDGQQRLTSLYIGLHGTYSFKMPRKRWDNDDAFPKRKLCLNLLAPSASSELEYDFKFLTEEERSQSNDLCYWYVVGDILDIKEQFEVNAFLVSNLDPNQKAQFLFANRALFKLFEVIHINKSINFFLEKDESLDKVLNIFIRVNSGGTQLNYSDLLLSIATAQWQEKDAREEITSFVDEINAAGDGFNFNKDFVLKSCLVIGSFKDIAFKVDNFNQQNMRSIESQWDEISKAIKAAVVLISSLGYQRDTLTSNNAVIPIANYLKKIGCPDNFSESSKYSKDRQLISKWLAIVLLKRIFGAHPDNVLRSIREVIAAGGIEFPYEEIARRLKGLFKPVAFDNDDIGNLLFYEYGQSYTYSVLTLIYQTLDFRNKFHQDHIFPKRFFTETRLKKRGIKGDNVGLYLESFNRVTNIQLLEGIPNQEKSGKDFDVWLKEQYPDKAKRLVYMERHYIPDIDLSFSNFLEFVEEREKLVFTAFKKILT